MYIQLTDIDVQTKILCTDEPMRTGPALPEIKNFKFVFSNESEYPIALNADGSYVKPTRYYGICDDDADTSLTGVLSILTEEEFNLAKQSEHEARKPYPSWVGNMDTMSWQPPVAYPQDGKNYYWDEPTTSWKEQTQVVQIP